MPRYLFIAAALVATLSVPVEAKRIARAFTPVEKFGRADAVVAGKVTAVEKETVDAIRFPGDTEKVPYTIAVLKVDTSLLGADSVTHVKVGFIAPAPGNAVPGRPVRGGFQSIALTEGQEGLYFLTKHPSGEFYTISPMMAPLDPKAPNYKALSEQITKAAAALADPMKALKSDQPAERYFAATVLLSKYRSFPENGGETEMVKVPADESQRILKAIADADWKKNEPETINAQTAFYQLGLSEAAGWVQPQPKPGVNFQDAVKESFVKWLEGPGKDYQIERIVPKKK